MNSTGSCLQDTVVTEPEIATEYLHTHRLLKVLCDPWWNGLFTEAQCVFVHVWGLFTVCQLIMYNSSLSPMCASHPLPLWPDNLHLSLLILRLSSTILPSLSPSVHPWVSLFIQSDGVGPTCHCLSMWANTHRHTQTHTNTYTQTLCSPPIYLTQCLYSLAPNWPLAGQMDGWPTVVPLSSLTHTHTHTQTHNTHTLLDTHNKDMPIGLLQEHKYLFRILSFLYFL